MTFRTITILLAGITTTVLLGCATSGSSVRIPESSSNSLSRTSLPAGYTYEVRVGDNLKWIASTFTRDRNNWEKIAEFNGISNPAKITVGQVITIPTELYVNPLDLPVAAAAPADISPVAAVAAPANTAPVAAQRKADFFEAIAKETKYRRSGWGERAEKFIGDYFSGDENKDIPENVSRVWIDEYIDQQFAVLSKDAEGYSSSGISFDMVESLILTSDSVYVPESQRSVLLDELRKKDEAREAQLDKERESRFALRRDSLMQRYGEVSDARMIELAKAEIKESLIDPASAQFTRVTMS